MQKRLFLRRGGREGARLRSGARLFEALNFAVQVLYCVVDVHVRRVYPDLEIPLPSWSADTMRGAYGISRKEL